MDNGGASNNPIVNPQTPVVRTNPLKQTLKTNMFVILILLAVIIATATIAVVIFRNSQSQKSDNTATPSSQALPIDLKVEYQNPFDKSAQYENPFENLK